jgi:hypothetical protein
MGAVTAVYPGGADLLILRESRNEVFGTVQMPEMPGVV